jgi:hypothetical protein
MLPGVQVARKIARLRFEADPGFPKAILETGVRMHPTVEHTPFQEGL